MSNTKILNDYLSILGLKTYNYDNIKKEYKKLANKFHPDKSGGDTDKFIKITEAYQYLISHPPIKTSIFNLDITFLESLTGIKINTHIGVIDIPAGIKDKQKIYHDNCIIEITVLDDDRYVREKDDIFATLYISSLLAITGGEHEFIGPCGNTMSLNIPSLMDAGTIIKIEKEGALNIKTGIKGDLYIKCLLKTPQLTQDVISAILAASNIK